MPSVRRFDPSPVADAPASSPDDAAAVLRARLAERKLKRKREQLDEGVPEAATKTVHFSDAVSHQDAPPLPLAATFDKPAPTSKTKAKQRYLKNKKTRYKAHQKALPKEQRARGAPTTGTIGDGANEPTVKANGKADLDRAARRELRKAKRRAEREAREAAAAAEEGDNAVAYDATEPPSLKRKSTTDRASEPVLDDDEVFADVKLDAAVPVGLERFPKPRKLVAPDRSVLKELGVAEEVRDGMQISSDLTVELAALTSRASGEPLISSAMRQKLRNVEIISFFAVQAAVLPFLLEPSELYPAAESMSDLCVSAPTGSGKTLAYVLPIIETLSGRIVTRLRALLVLPTRDLADQVRETFVAFCQGTGLKVGSAGCGSHSFSREQDMLSGGSSKPMRGGHSNVDILVATPGRLLEHLRSTPNFTLQHLRYFVIDEADRLIGASFNEWLPTVLEELDRTDLPAIMPEAAIAPHLLPSVLPLGETLLDGFVAPTVQKLLFSATLSRDPAQIAGLKLNKPIYIAVGDAVVNDLATDESFALPASLKEYMITASASAKPLLLFHLLFNRHVDHALCFTKSIDAASRLVKLVELFAAEHARTSAIDIPPLRVAAYSSDLPGSKRAKLLDAFKAGDIRLLVCSDLIARGMDLPHVAHVISYDVPVDMRKYVHRVGRTARAGREGQAWSLVESQEVGHFQEMLKSAGRVDKVARERVKKADLQKLQPAYEAALSGLRQHYTSR